MPKNGAVAKNMKALMPLPMHNETNDSFVCTPTLVDEIDLEEEHCPSKIKRQVIIPMHTLLKERIIFGGK